MLEELNKLMIQRCNIAWFGASVSIVRILTRVLLLLEPAELISHKRIFVHQSIVCKALNDGHVLNLALGEWDASNVVIFVFDPFFNSNLLGLSKFVTDFAVFSLLLIISFKFKLRDNF